jgi:hypothetical protein
MTMKRHQLVIFSFLLLLGWSALAAKRAPKAAPVTQDVMGLDYTETVASVQIAKGERVTIPTEPAQVEDCTRGNWQTCNAACGGIAFTCKRDATYYFMGCAPRCWYAVHVKLACGCGG